MAYFQIIPLGGLLLVWYPAIYWCPNTIILAEGIVAVLIAFIFLPFLRYF